MTFVNGINGYVANRIFNLGADVFIVSKISPVITNIDQFLEGQKRKDLTMEDYEAVVAGCGDCQYVGASVIQTGMVKYADQYIEDTMIRGITPSMGPIFDLDIVAGRMINNTDLENASRVAIIGNDIQEKLMPGVDPLGREIRVAGEVYTVIGVGKKEGKVMGQSRDNYVYLPVSAWQRQFGTHQSIRISAKAAGLGPQFDAAQDEVRAVLRSRRHDLPGQPDSFALETNASFLGIWSSISSSFFIAMIAIAAISLIVGGIVIMNMQLVSVTERTREIGIRKALGARRGDVLRQFLIESSTMAIVGGTLGIALGIAVAKGITWWIGMPSAIKLWAIGAGLLVSATVGIFFGVYPARRAANLEPIAALRFEL